MTSNQFSHRQAEHGFTLVELAIVMVIIGLLIGGILKGQELIANARVSATVSKIKGVDAAMNTFQDKYNVLPGDMASPATRLPNCTTVPCSTAGTGGTLGNGRIEGGALTAAPGAGDEAGVAFVQLGAADMVSGISPTGGATFGGQFPDLDVGGGMWVAYTGVALANTLLPANRHYAALAGSPTGAVAAANGALTPIIAAQIDRKLDDGNPQTGSYQTFGTGCLTGTGATATYNESSTPGGTCTSYMRVLN
jgi:prepilin-type N-terminal cleavage/methylation domain-containing protein